MLASHDGALWVGTQDGVYRRAPGGAAFERVRLDDGRRLAGNINALVEGAGGIWVGGNSGLHHALPGRNSLQRVRALQEHDQLKPQVLGLLVGRGDVLWIDTSAGLHRLMPWDGQQARFEALAASG